MLATTLSDFRNNIKKAVLSWKEQVWVLSVKKSRPSIIHPEVQSCES